MSQNNSYGTVQQEAVPQDSDTTAEVVGNQEATINNDVNLESPLYYNNESTSLLARSGDARRKRKRGDDDPNPQASGVSDYLKSALFGGLDGISAVFVSVATIYSGNVTMMAVLIIGIAKLLSGAISMGVGDYISSKAELDLIRLERKREMWECENFLRGEKEEMVSIYKEKGLRQEVAGEMVDIMSQNKKAFVDVMMVQELGLKPDFDPYGPLKNGLTNFGAFVFFGSIPLIIYAVFIIVDKVRRTNSDKNMIFYVDCGITAATLLFMGLVKSRFSSQKWYTSMILTLLVGAIASAVGYGVAYVLVKILHLHNVG